MYDSQQSTGLPDHPVLRKLMDTNVSPHENVSRKKKMESAIYRKVARGNGAKMIHQYISCALKWRGKDVSKNGSVLPVPCTWTVKTSTERITSSSRAGFLVHAKKNIKSLPVSHSSTVFPLHLKATIEGKENFSISASDTSETWA